MEAPDEATVHLTTANGHSQYFTPAHAEALLAYPGSLWTKAKAPKAEAVEDPKPKK